MKITKYRNGPTQLDIMIDGKWSKVGRYRETLNAQGVVLVHPSLNAGSQVYSYDPKDEESPLREIDNAVTSHELAEIQKGFAMDTSPEGTFEVELTL